MGAVFRVDFATNLEGKSKQKRPFAWWFQHISMFYPKPRILWGWIIQSNWPTKFGFKVEEELFDGPGWNH